MYLGLGKQKDERLRVYQSLFQAHIDMTALDNIRSATNKGLALGSERFTAQIEALTGRRVTARKPGPKNTLKPVPPDKARQEFLL